MNTKGTALITGASTGIGAVYADRLARRGYDLILVARSREAMDELAGNLIRVTGRSIRVIAADLTLGGDLAQVEEVLRTDATITMLVNNAGISIGGDLAKSDPNRLESMILLNVVAPSRLAAAAIPGFLGRGHGTLINLSSVVALAPEQSSAGYAGTRAYMLAFTLRLQSELAGKGVRVQAVLPGATRTAIWEKAGKDLASLPPESVMEVDEMVDAALAGLDMGEAVTVPSLPDVAEWEAFEAARRKMATKLSRRSAAPRYAPALQSTV